MDTAEKAKRIRFVMHKAKRILLFDFTRLENMDDALEVIRHARQSVAGQPPNSLLTLTDISNSRYDRDVTAALQELAKHNKPYVVAGAAVGVSGLQKVVFRSILAFSGRTNIKLFDDRESAMDWLASYEGWSFFGAESMKIAFLKFVVFISAGAGLGGVAGYLVQCTGGGWAVTGGPWSGAIFGAMLGLFLALIPAENKDNVLREDDTDKTPPEETP